MTEINNNNSTTLSVAHTKDPEQMSKMSGETVYLFLGILIAIFLQLVTSIITELLAIRRERRSSHVAAENSMRAYCSDVMTILERGGRDNDSVLNEYTRIWSSLPNGTKAKYSKIVEHVDKEFWRLEQLRKDINYSNSDYSKEKKSLAAKLDTMIEAKNTSALLKPLDIELKKS